MIKEFKSVDDIKSRGEFLPKGRIMPTRIVRASKRKKQHCIITGSNQWAIPTLTGYLIFVENNDGQFDCVARIRNVVNCEFYFAPYHIGGTSFLGNADLSELESVFNFNKEYFKMNLVNYKE